MANTYNVIASQTLSTSSSSIVFSAIPQTYSDLILRITARTTTSSTNLDWFYLTASGDTTAIYSWVRILSNGGTGSANRNNSVTPVVSGASYFGYVQGDGTTANSFSSTEMYFADYTNTSYRKQVQIFTQTTNAVNTTSYTSQHANYIDFATAITSITLNTQTSFASGSTFVLHGIKNS
jgi:hypothetical protein